jgi:hypothetical protein
MAARLTMPAAPGGRSAGSRARRLLLPGALMLAVGLGLTATALPTLSADCGCWRYVRLNADGTPATASTAYRAETTLSDVAAPSYQVAWAVGSRGSDALLARWTGLGWRETALPVPADTLLEGVAAASPRDAWTIGYGPGGTPRAAHWDGDGWRSMPVPGQTPAFPRAIDARTAGDAWIVGSGGSGVTQATTWHWDGRSWQQVVIPDGPGTASTLAAVSARAPDDVWAVGGRGSFPARQLILHWDGQGWTPYTAPDLDGEAILSDVVALGRADVWAVGSTTVPAPTGSAPGTVTDRPLAEHWDGRSWRDVPLPEASGRFYGVTGDGHGGIWAAGERPDGRGFFARWDGARWELSAAPAPGAPGTAAPSAAVWNLARISGTDYLWAVGAYEPLTGELPARRAITWTNAPRPR